MNKLFKWYLDFNDWIMKVTYKNKYYIVNTFELLLFIGDLIIKFLVVGVIITIIVMLCTNIKHYNIKIFIIMLLLFIDIFCTYIYKIFIILTDDLIKYIKRFLIWKKKKN